MTVLSMSINPGDYHDSRCLNPTAILSTIQYQIQPLKYFTLPLLQQYVTDINNIPASVHANSVLSFCISNTSFQRYENLSLLKSHIDILWENCKLQRVNFDFTQCQLSNIGITERIITIVSHIQKHKNYNVFVSVSLPINKELTLSTEYLDLLLQFKAELININMVNLLIPKEIKKKSISWPEMVNQMHANVTKQLKQVDSDGLMFIGDINKYIGISFDCDISTNSNSLLTSAVRNNIIHGEKKNMSQLDFLSIWKWCNMNNIGHVEFKWYLSNCKNLNMVLQRYAPIVQNHEHLPLPQEMIANTVEEMVAMSDSESLPDYNEAPQYAELMRIPSYRTVCS